MSKSAILRKLQLYKKNPELFREVSNQELADLVLIVMGAVQAIDQSIEDKRLNIEAKYDAEAKTLVNKAERQYTGLIKDVTAEVNRLINTSDTVLSETSTELERRVQTAIQSIRNGDDGIVTEAEIERAAEMAAMLIETPDYDALVTEHLTKNANATRDGLELFTEEEDKLRQSAIQNLPKDLDEIRNSIENTKRAAAGGVSKNTVQAMIDATPAGSGVPDGGTTGQVLTKQSNTDGDADWETVAGTGDVTAASAFGTDNRLIKSDGTGKGVQSTGITVADTSNNVSGVGTLNTHTIPGGTGTIALTSDLHDAVTVADSSEIDFTLTGQQISAAIVASSIDESKLDASVNASLDLADTSVQPGDNATDLDGTAHRLFYTDGSGDITELAFGTDGQVLTSTGTTTAPAFETPSGGGNNYFNNQFIDQSGGTSDTYGALSGSINSSNAVFTVSQGAYATGTLEVFLNGKLVLQGTGGGWTETTPASGTFTFVEAPVTGDEITVRYQTATLSAETVVTQATNFLTKGVTIPEPTATEDITLFFTDDAITITQLNAVVRGTSPSVTWTIRHGTDRSATGAEVVTSGTTTTSVSSGSEVTSFNDSTVPAGSWIWLETTGASGTNDELSVSIEYVID